MARLTLRIPDSLHATLRERAATEGVSMNQYIVYALSRAATVQQVLAQQTEFASLLTRYPAAEAEAALAGLLAERDAAG